MKEMTDCFEKGNQPSWLEKGRKRGFTACTSCKGREGRGYTAAAPTPAVCLSVCEGRGAVPYGFVVVVSRRQVYRFIYHLTASLSVYCVKHIAQDVHQLLEL